MATDMLFVILTVGSCWEPSSLLKRTKTEQGALNDHRAYIHSMQSGSITCRPQDELVVVGGCAPNGEDS